MTVNQVTSVVKCYANFKSLAVKKSEIEEGGPFFFTGYCISIDWIVLYMRRRGRNRLASSWLCFVEQMEELVDSTPAL